MTVEECASMLKISKVAITKRLQVDNPPGYIKSYRKFGNTYDLQVDTILLSKLIAKKNRKEIIEA